METNTTHSVYEHPDGRREIIKMGFCWPAFFFGPLWAWKRGMVVLGFLWLVLLQLITPVLRRTHWGSGNCGRPIRHNRCVDRDRWARERMATQKCSEPRF